MLNTLTKKRNEQKKKRGFTLIELIIVIAIIAILAAVAIPKFLNVTDDANRKADLANAKTIESTVTMLIANGKITVPSAGITAAALPDSPGAEASGEATVNTIARSLQSVPKSKTVKDASFYVSIDGNGTIHVYPGNGADVKDLLHPQ